jgi:hypothetical protein
MPRTLRNLMLCWALGLSCATHAQSPTEAQVEFSPATPVQNAATRLSITGFWRDTCTPVDANVEFSTPVSNSGDVSRLPSLLRVILRLPQTFQACLPAPTRYTLELNAVQFPVGGDYRVELVASFGSPATENIRGSRNVRVATAIEAIGQHSLQGAWFEPQSSGSGLMLTQLRTARRDVVFGTWHNYRSDSSASWVALQGGGWETPTRYRGDVYTLQSQPYGICAAIGCGIVLPPYPADRMTLIGRYRIDMQGSSRADLVFEALAGQPAAPLRVIALERLQ